MSYGKSTHADSPLVPVIFRIRNVGSLLSGSFVTTYIVTQSDREALTVPNESIVEEMGNYFLFVKVHEGEYEKRLVTIGATDGLRTEISHYHKEPCHNHRRQLRISGQFAACSCRSAFRDQTKNQRHAALDCKGPRRPNGEAADYIAHRRAEARCQSTVFVTKINYR